MPRPEDTLEQLARLARDDEVLHAASERKPTADPSADESSPVSVLPDSLTEPISDAQRSSVVDAIQARLARSERSETPVPLVSILRLRRRRSALVTVVALIAVAAGAVLALRVKPDEEGPLSHYEVRLEGAEHTERGSADVSGALLLHPSSKLRFELRPRNDERGNVRARAFVQGLPVAGARETRELTVSQEQSAAGALRVAAQLPPSLAERGELLLYVGRPAAVESVQPRAPSGALQPSNLQEFRWQFERVP